jgi:hypothetical protein
MFLRWENVGECGNLQPVNKGNDSTPKNLKDVLSPRNSGYANPRAIAPVSPTNHAITLTTEITGSFTKGCRTERHLRSFLRGAVPKRRVGDGTVIVKAKKVGDFVQALLIPTDPLQ